ncbi:MAG: hypothetical protein M1510_09125 [Nitrospirae bacterium]|nr:hypothetical protein [Nitrospirota bacterium]
MSITGAFLIFSSLTVPGYKEAAKLQDKLNTEHWELSKKAALLEAVRKMPSFDFAINTGDDTALILKHLIERNNYQIASMSKAADSIGEYVECVIDFGGYASLSGVLVFLEDLRTMLPVAYTKYELGNRSIKVHARCYFKEA